MEDFGWSGDEFLIGDCQDDWNMDMIDARADARADERGYESERYSFIREQRMEMKTLFQMMLTKTGWRKRGAGRNRKTKST